MKKCIHCAEDIQDEAKTCKHCGKLQKNNIGFWGWIGIVFFGLILLSIIGNYLPQEKKTNNSESMTSVSQILTELKSPTYLSLGFRRVWTEGNDDQILKISVSSEWYLLSKDNKEKALTLIGEKWKQVQTKSAARLEVEDYYSGKQVGYYGSWGVKIN